MIVRIIVGSMLDYPAGYLFIGSNVRGHCENPTSNVMQVLPLLEPESRGEYARHNKELQEYGTGSVYACTEDAHFNLIYIGYPGTGHQESFEKMLDYGLNIVNILGLKTGATNISMPLIGTNVGGLDLNEWCEGFNKVLTEYDEKDVKFIEAVTIVCNTEEQATFLKKTISPFHRIV